MIKAIIAIGNPDVEYDRTRHNVGFMVSDMLSHSVGGEFELDKQLKAFIFEYKLNVTKIVVAKPTTFVNKTGESVLAIKKKYKLKNENILLIHDDLDLRFGQIKLSFGRNSGGHKGVESVTRQLKDNNFFRIRIGIANAVLKRARKQHIDKKKELVAKFVLSEFSKPEKAKLKSVLKNALAKIEENL